MLIYEAMLSPQGYYLHVTSTSLQFRQLYSQQNSLDIYYIYKVFFYLLSVLDTCFSLAIFFSDTVSYIVSSWYGGRGLNKGST